MTCLDKLEEQLQDIQRQINECKEQPTHRIAEIIKQYSTVRSCTKSIYSNSNRITVVVENFSGDCSLREIYKELGYYCTQAATEVECGKPITSLRFDKI